MCTSCCQYDIARGGERKRQIHKRALNRPRKLIISQVLFYDLSDSKPRQKYDIFQSKAIRLAGSILSHHTMNVFMFESSHDQRENNNFHP